jgi:SAM-dependent methyltransferase
MKAAALLFSMMMLCVSPFYAEESGSETVFEEIYRKGIWGRDGTGYGSSGGGSTLAEGRPFIQYIEHFLNTHEIQSIVDVGCGDWVLAKEIHWGMREYIGIDVVKILIKRNQLAHSTKNIHFMYLDAAEKEIPGGDLLICKDVLQHLSNRCIAHILSESKKFKYCIFVNDIHPWDAAQNNRDIRNGEHHTLDLVAWPFNLQPLLTTCYVSGPNIKQIILVKAAAAQGQEQE